VRDHDRCRATCPAEGLQHFDDRSAAVLVERRGRFIGEDDLGTDDQRAGHGDALLLSARQAHGKVVEPVAQPDEVEHVIGRSPHFHRIARPVHLEAHQAGGKARVQVVALENEAKPPPQGVLSPGGGTDQLLAE
jgi:hypothetical protein